MRQDLRNTYGVKPEVLGKHFLVAHDQLHLAEELSQVWVEAKQDLKRVIVASFDNLVESISTTREDFNDEPKKMGYLVMQVPLPIRSRYRLGSHPFPQSR
jgi:hypothetical protein